MNRKNEYAHFLGMNDNRYPTLIQYQPNGKNEEQEDL